MNAVDLWCRPFRRCAACLLFTQDVTEVLHSVNMTSREKDSTLCWLSALVFSHMSLASPLGKQQDNQLIKCFFRVDSYLLEKYKYSIVIFIQSLGYLTRSFWVFILLASHFLFYCVVDLRRWSVVCTWGSWFVSSWWRWPERACCLREGSPLSFSQRERLRPNTSQL